MQFCILQNIAGTNVIFFSGNIVHIAVFISDIDGIGVNIHGICFFCFQEQRCDGQDTAATADIQNHIVFLHISFDQFHAQLCGFMSTCTENMTGVDFQDNFVCRFCQFFPGGFDHNFFPYREGFEIFLPVIRPVFFLYIFHFQFQRTQIQFLFRFLHCCQCRSDLCQLLSAVKVISHKESDACHQLFFFFHQLIGNIIPVSVGVFQKFCKIGCIVDHQTCQTTFIQHGFHRLQTHLACRYEYFDPFHLYFLLSEISGKRN